MPPDLFDFLLFGAICLLIGVVYTYNHMKSKQGPRLKLSKKVKQVPQRRTEQERQAASKRRRKAAHW